MNDIGPAAVAFAGGILLGTFFFGGLWWTVRKGVASTRPVFWFLGSMLLRTSVTVVGFYWIGRDHWRRLLVCLCGFIVARVLVMWLTRLAKNSPTPSIEEARHAS